MIVDCAHYRDGRRQDEGAMPLEQAAARCRQGGFVWLGVFEPSPGELDRVREIFGLHELAVEDAAAFHLRPKAEQYEDGTELIILRTARYDDEREEIDTGEISVFLADHFVITVRQGIASELHEARSRLESRPELLKTGSSSTLWAILDQVVDSYAPVVGELERDIEQIEATVFSGAVAPTERIYSLRREATDFYRAVHPLLAVLTRRLQPGRTPPALQPYMRDVHDHLLLVNEEVAAQRDPDHRPGSEHRGDLRGAEQDQPSAERHDGTAHDPRERIPPAVLRGRLLRAELRLAGHPHQQLHGVPHPHPPRGAPSVPAAVRLAPPAPEPADTAVAGSEPRRPERPDILRAVNPARSAETDGRGDDAAGDDL